MKAFLIALACQPIAFFITWHVITWSIYLFQEINHTLRNAMRHIREVFWDFKWMKVQFNINKKWR